MGKPTTGSGSCGRVQHVRRLYPWIRGRLQKGLGISIPGCVAALRPRVL